ncbi:MAG: hypothetical protein RBG13Loki_3951, partial [Promethearchaeota archaeon CR_4]
MSVKEISYLNDIALGGTWHEGTTINVDVAGLWLPAGIHFVTLQATDGLGLTSSFTHRVVVDNHAPVVTKVAECENVNWKNAQRTPNNGYNLGDPSPLLTPIHWTITDGTVNPAGGFYYVQMYAHTGQAGDSWQNVVGVANASGTWRVNTANVSDIYFTPPASLTAPWYSFRVIVNDLVPGSPEEVTPGHAKDGECFINFAPEVTIQGGGEYTTYGYYDLKWHVADAKVSCFNYSIQRLNIFT